jgi:hypothetical protein
MPMRKPIIALFALLFVAGCAGTVTIKNPDPMKPSQVIAKADLEVQRAWSQVKPYVDQEPCVPLELVVGCAEPEIKAELEAAKKKAGDALDMAWELYREGKSPDGQLALMKTLRAAMLATLNKAIIEQQKREKK